MRENSYLNYILTGVSLLLFAGWWFVWSLHILSLIYGKWRLHRPIHNKYGLPRARQNNGLCCRNNSNPTTNKNGLSPSLLYDKAEPNTISCYDFSKLHSHNDQSPINTTVSMKNMLTDKKYGTAIPPDNSVNRTEEPKQHSGCWTNLDLLSSPSLDTLTNATSYQCTHTTSSNKDNIDSTENNLGSFTNPNFKLSLDEANTFASDLNCDTSHPSISVANLHGKQQHEKGLFIPNDDKSCVKTLSLLTNSTHSRSLSLGANKHYHASIPGSSDHYLKIPPITISGINNDISKNANNHIVSCVNNHETTAANSITGSFNQQHYRSLSGGYAPSALCLLKGNTNGSVSGPNHLTTHQQLHETTRLIKFSNNNNSVTNHAKRYAATTTQIQVSGLNPAVSMSQNLLLNINTHSHLSNTSSNDNAISKSIISISSSSSVSTLQNNVNEVAVSIPITESGNDSPVNNKHLSTTNICPGVSIIKPLLGIDTHLEYNLETFFHLDYAKYEICFCIQDPKDPCVELVRTLMEKHPHIDATLFTGGPEVVVNAKINNMLPAYNAAKYEYILISDAGIMMLPDALTDMVNAMTPKIGLVHQMPFTADYRKGFSAILEKVYFGTAHARIYLVSDFLHINCCTGMSSMFRKSLIDRLPGGIAMFGKYLAEDYFMARAVRQAGYSHRISTRPALQNPGIAIDAPLTSTYDTVKLTFDTLPITTCSSQTVTDIKPSNELVDVFDIKVHNQNGTSNPKNGKNENIIDSDLNLDDQKFQHVMYEQENNHIRSTKSSTHKANNDKNCNNYVDPNPSTISSLPCKNILNNVAISSTSNKVTNKPISTPLPALPMRHKLFLRKNGIIRKCARRLIRNLKLVPVCFPNIMSGGFCWKGVRSFQERLIRWSKLRFAMEPVTIFFEPLSECLLLGLLNSWAVFYLFDWNSVLFFIIHCVVWLILDYTLLRIVQHDKLPFTRAEFVCAWLYREISALPLFFIALSTSVLKWKNNTYKLRWGGYVTKVHSHQLLFPPSSPIKKANRKLDFSTFKISSFRDKNVSYLANDDKSVPQTILSSSKRFFGFIIVTPLGKLYTNMRKISPFKINSLRRLATFTHLIRSNSKSSLNITSTEKINKSSINYGISNNIVNSGSSPTHTLSLRDKAIMDTFSETFVQIDVSFDEKN